MAIELLKETPVNIKMKSEMQPCTSCSEMIKMFNKKSIIQNQIALEKLWKQELVTVSYNGKTYILDGHNRFKTLAELGLDTPKQAKIRHLTPEQAWKDYKNKMKYIVKDEFNLKITD